MPVEGDVSTMTLFTEESQSPSKHSENGHSLQKLEANIIVSTSGC